MADINELLEKYFNGETSIQEENQLKEYLKSVNVTPEHKSYSYMFDVFETERQETYPGKIVKQIDNKPEKDKRIWLKIISISGIAASVLLAFWFFSSSPANEDYAIINGKRINDQDYIQQLTNAKLEKVNGMLAKSMKPLQSIEKVRNSLEPVRKISQVKMTLNDVKNKLNLKD